MNTATTPETPTQTTASKDKFDISSREGRQACARRLREMYTELRAQPSDPDDYQRRILLRYPRLVAHLICKSSGYFCPRSAANAIHKYRDRQGFYCEWYCHITDAHFRGQPGPIPREIYDAQLVETGANILNRAFEQRHYHRGFMAEYFQARLVCLGSVHGNDPIFASWF